MNSPETQETFGTRYRMTIHNAKYTKQKAKEMNQHKHHKKTGAEPTYERRLSVTKRKLKRINSALFIAYFCFMCFGLFDFAYF